MKVTPHQIAIAFVSAGVIALAVWNLGAATGNTAKKTGPDEAIPVQIAAVKRGPVDLSVSNVGTVLALNTVVLRPRIDAPIQSVRFREGQLVGSGEVLIELLLYALYLLQCLVPPTLELIGDQSVLRV